MRRAVSVLVAAVGIVAGVSACSSSTPASAARTTAHVPPATTAHRGVTRAVTGRVLVRSIPGTTSGFAARPAIIYLPPAAVADPHRRLPVLMLLHGTSGGPRDWLTKAHLAPALAGFAAAHGGAAPIVVLPDINGAVHADTECVGRSEQYLAVDVPRYVSSHFAAGPPARWALAGISEGGTCALMLSLRHPQAFPTFGDLGGLVRPTVGSFDAPAATVRALFGGSWTAYREHDPSWLLRHRVDRSLVGWLEDGAADPTRRDQATLVRLSRAAGLSVVARLIPGGHDWTVWRRATIALLSWFWTRTGSPS